MLLLNRWIILIYEVSHLLLEEVVKEVSLPQRVMKRENLV